MSTDNGSKTSSEKRYLQLLVFGSFLIPFVCIPYIPIRHHLLALRRSIHTLSSDTSFLQREVSNALLNAHLRKEESLKLAGQVREFRAQLDAATKRIAESENARLNSERDVAERIRAALDRASEMESTRLKTEQASRQEVDVLRIRVDAERIPQEVLQDVCTSLGDTAAFIEEVEINLGWSHTMPRDRGIERMRRLALKLHTMSQAKPYPNDT